MLETKTECSIIIKSPNTIIGAGQKVIVILETEMYLNQLDKIHLKESNIDIYLRFHFGKLL